MSSNKSTLSFDLLHAAVSNPELGLTSVEKVLAWITANYPDYLKHYTLMRESLSAQDSSDSHPRAIVYGEDGSFILTFNGAPEQRGFDRIEMIQFRKNIAHDTPNQRRSAFEFREIQFYDDDRLPSVSKANPDSCKQCHYAPSRPIWEPYDKWPGAYGERDDAIVDYENERYPSPAATPDEVAFHTKQLQGYRSFQSIKQTHPRYKWLVPPPSTYSDVSPYSPRIRFSYYQYRPNLALTDRLVRLHAENLAQQVASQSSCHEVFSEFLVAKFMNCEIYRELADLKNSLDDLVTSQWERVAGPEYDNFLPWTKFPSNDPMTKKARLLSLVGIETSDYSMSRVPKHWDFYEGSNYLSDFFAAALFKRMAQVDPTLGEYTKQYNGYSHQIINRESDLALCRNLYQRAHSKMRGLVLQPDCRLQPSEIIPKPEVVQMCASCHEDANSGAPAINFSDQEALRADKEIVETILIRIQERNSPIQMPPNRPLSQKEQDTLKEYLGVPF